MVQLVRRALANTIEHPTNVYLLESAVMPALDGWLAGLFEPEALPWPRPGQIRPLIG